MAALPTFAESPASSHDWLACLQRFETASREYRSALQRLGDVQAAFFEARPTRPLGSLILRSKGRTFTMEEAVANMNDEHAAWEAADKACRDQCGVDDAEEAYQRTLNAESTALAAVFNCPAPDVLAVAKKIELAIEYNCDIDEIGPAIADLKRLGMN
jgi:hypothetical protein